MRTWSQQASEDSSLKEEECWLGGEFLFVLRCLKAEGKEGMELQKVQEGSRDPGLGWTSEGRGFGQEARGRVGVMQLHFKCGGNKLWESLSQGLYFL